MAPYNYRFLISTSDGRIMWQNCFLAEGLSQEDRNKIFETHKSQIKQQFGEDTQIEIMQLACL